MCRSRAVLARMEAAAIAAQRPSPPTNASAAQPRSNTRLPSIRAVTGRSASWSTARRMASPVAWRMFRSAISATVAKAKPKARAVARISASSAARAAAVSALESFRPTGIRRGSRITAAAVTGPAQGPRPASSTPQTGPG